MMNTEPGPRAKEALSWMIISEVLRQSALDLNIAVLHPGGGQYDTLSLVTFEGKTVVHVNRNGVNALAGDALIKNVFQTAAKSPHEAGKSIVEKIGAEIVLDFSAHKRQRIKCAVQIADFLAFHLYAGASCDWGWHDSPYHVGPSNRITEFQIPAEWKKQNGLFKDTSWESGIYLLFRNQKPFAVINMMNGQVIDSEGQSMENLQTKNYQEDGMYRCHLGLKMTFKNQEGKILFEDEVPSAMTRMTRRIYSEEYLVLPEEEVIFEFSCDEEESISKWRSAEGLVEYNPELS